MGRRLYGRISPFTGGVGIPERRIDVGKIEKFVEDICEEEEEKESDNY